MNSKDISGNKQVSATNLALERVKVRVPPPKEFVGKVKRSLHLLGIGVYVHTLKAEPYSYLAQRAGTRHLRMLARTLWSRVLAEELGAGQEKGSRRRAGPAGRKDALPLGVPAGPAPGGGAPAAPALAALSLRVQLFPRPPARGEPPPPSWRPGPLAPRAGPAPGRLFSLTRFPGLGSRTPRRRWVGRWHFEAGNQMLGSSGRDSGGAAGSPASGPRRRAGGREARPGRQPRPARTRGSKRCRGKPRRWATTGARRLLPVSSLPLAHPRQSQSPAARGERHHQIWGDPERPQSKAQRERERRLSELAG